MVVAYALLGLICGGLIWDFEGSKRVLINDGPYRKTTISKIQGKLPEYMKAGSTKNTIRGPFTKGSMTDNVILDGVVKNWRGKMGYCGVLDLDDESKSPVPVYVSQETDCNRENPRVGQRVQVYGKICWRGRFYSGMLPKPRQLTLSECDDTSLWIQAQKLKLFD